MPPKSKLPSRESQREMLDRLAGFEDADPPPTDSNPLWDDDIEMFYIGGGRYLSIYHPKIKRLLKAGKLELPPEFEE